LNDFVAVALDADIYTSQTPEDKIMRIAFPPFRRALLAAAFLPSMTAVAFAADVSVQPASGSGFVVKDASGANERLRVQENGAITLPGIAGAAAQVQPLCVGSAGLLGLCGGSGSGGSYSAGTGLSLAGGAFSIAPTFQLPQTCAVNQLAQWSGTAWGCAVATAGGLPAGTANQTLRYDGGNALAATSDLQVMSDGGVLATNAAVNAAYATEDDPTPTGAVPTSGSGARMMWYPAKAAFRAGFTNSQWDDANIGRFSSAMGFRSEASGDSSTAMGHDTRASGSYSTAMGDGTIASGSRATAMGGFITKASGDYSTAMGFNTSASGYDSTSMGDSTIASGSSSTAMGSNTTASGDKSTAMGIGTTAGGKNSTAMGANAVVTSGSDGSFVYGDGTAVVTNAFKNQFMVLASSNTTFYSGTNNGGAQSTWPGVILQQGAGAWSTLSDHSAKSDFASVDARAVLDRVVALPLSTWRYNGQDKSIRHIGPIAQDFYAAFDVGEDERHISTVDADGVALAAIQGLNLKLGELDVKTSLLLNEKDREIAELRERIAHLEMQTGEIAALKSAVAALQRQPAEFDAMVVQP